MPSAVSCSALLHHPWQLAAKASALLPRYLAPYNSSNVPRQLTAGALMRTRDHIHMAASVPWDRAPEPPSPDIFPDPTQPRRNPDILPPGQDPDFPPPRPPAPDIYPRVPQPDVPPSDPFPGDLPTPTPPDTPGQGPMMEPTLLWNSGPAASSGVDSVCFSAQIHGLGPCWREENDPTSPGTAVLRSPLMSWNPHLPLLKTDGGNALAEVERMVERRGGSREGWLGV